MLRVIDGDTIEVSIDGSEEDVRYIGVDTPETVKPGAPVQCYGPQASAANHRLVEGRTVRLVFDRERRDAYGRLLAYVYARASAKAAAAGGEAGKPAGSPASSTRPWSATATREPWRSRPTPPTRRSFGASRHAPAAPAGACGAAANRIDAG